MQTQYRFTMPSKNQTIRVIAQNIGETILALVVATVLIVIASGQINDVVNSISNTERVALEGQQQQEAISQLESQFKTIDGNDAKINDAFPHEDDILPFINAINAFGSQEGVQQSINFSSPNSYTTAGNITYYYIPYSIGLQGSMSQFISYLRDFNNLPYFTNITSLTLSAPNGIGSGMSLNAQAVLYIQQ